MKKITFENLLAMRRGAMSKRFLLPTIFIIVLAFCSFTLFRHSFGAYFFQDDWFSFTLAGEKLIGISSFFIPRGDVIYFRPLGMQIPFLFGRIFFGFQPYPFHIIIFLTFLFNSYLVYILIKRLVGDWRLSLAAAFFYATSALHFILFYWMATYSFVLGTTWYFLSLLFFLNSENKKNKLYWVSLAIFIVGLFTNEMIMTLPIVLGLYQLLLGKKKFLKNLLPFFAGIFFLVIMRFYFFPAPTSGNYAIQIGSHIFSNLKSYLFWSFNWSEIITEQMIRPFIFNFQLDPYKSVVVGSVISFFLLLALLFIFPAVSYFKKTKKSNLRLIIFAFLSYFIALFPVLFFTQHKFPYYLTISQLFFVLIFVSFLKEIWVHFSHNNKKEIRYLSIVAIIWVFQSFLTIQFNTALHWAPRRADISSLHMRIAKERYPQSIPKFIAVPDSSENKLALNNQDAFRIIFHSDFIETIYVPRQ